MGKTMFGIPGVKDKSQSGGAIAPRGTSGGQGAGERRPGGRPQSGQKRETNQKNPAPIAKPVMASPKPMGSTVQPQTAPRQKNEVSKTMFGMPALNLPIDESELTAPQEVETQTAAPDESNADAFGATMLGVSAVTNEMAKAAGEKQQVNSSQSGLAGSSAKNTPESSPVEKVQTASQIGSGTMVQPREEAPASSPEELQGAEEAAMTPVSDSFHGLTPPVDRSDEPSKGLVAGLIAGFLLMIGAIVFVAWKLLYS